MSKTTQSSTTTAIGQRKNDHIELCSTDQVRFRQRSTLLEEVRLVHQPLADLALNDIDLSTHVCGKRLRAPLVIAAMTGGTEQAAEINRQLASIAQARGYALGLGSQRAMGKDPSAAWTYKVREWAPDILLLGNIGLMQAKQMPTREVAQLVREVGADALCVHMNPAMELVQPEGDRDFRGGIDTFRRLVSELEVPVVAKETGCGISSQAARDLASVGVRWVDVSGAGGTSWVGVETLRAQKAGLPTEASLGDALWDWGIPTAVAVMWARRHQLHTIATGGLHSGMDVARALALGATAAGIARPVLQALQASGREGAEQYLALVESELAAVLLLAGARTPSELAQKPKLLGPELQRWLAIE